MSKQYYVELPSGTILETDRLDLWPEATRLTVKDGRVRLRAESMRRVRKAVSRKREVLTKVTHVARSGMSRSIECYVINGGELLNISGDVARIVGDPLDPKNGGVKVSGCGMDMGFHLVYTLSRYLFTTGYGLPMTLRGGTKTPRTAEEAAYLYKRGYRARGRNGETSGWETDGGYALRHRWI